MNLPWLGVGLVCLPGFEDVVRQVAHLCDVVEIEPQPYFVAAQALDGREFDPRLNAAAIDAISDLALPSLVHSVGYPVGGSKPGEPTSLSAIDVALQRLAPPWWSEHLNFLTAEHGGGRRHVGFLMPPVQSPDSVDICVGNIKRLQDRFGIPFAFETGTNYLQPHPNEIPDGAFWGEIAERADAGILLDLHNVWTNARNGRQPVGAVLNALPVERVWEVHLAAGQEHKGYWLDSHSGLPAKEILSLFFETIPTVPNLRAAILEIIPDHFVAKDIAIEDLESSLTTIRRCFYGRRNCPSEGGPARGLGAIVDRSSDLPEPMQWENALLAALVDGPDGTDRALFRHDPGIEIYQDLTAAVRKGSLADVIPWTLRYIWTSCGEATLEALLREYFCQHGPQPFPQKEAAQFALYLRDGMRLPFLDDILALEMTQHCAQVSGRVQLARLKCCPIQLMAFVSNPRASEVPKTAPHDVEVHPDSPRDRRVALRPA